MCFFVFLLFFFFNDTATTEIYTLSLHDALPISAHGGVEEWARAVFEAGAGLLFLAWSIWIFFNREEQLVLSPLLPPLDRKSTRLNSSHSQISYAVFCLKKKKNQLTTIGMYYLKD